MSKQSTPLLKDYQIMLREAAACKPGKPPLYATISFGENISQVFPYLNRILKGRGIIEDPPTLVIHKDEHQIVLKAHSITISNLTEQTQAKHVMQWLHEIINSTWNRRDTISPLRTPHKSPQVLDILPLLPQTNCQKCGEATCMAFAVQLLQGIYSPNNCPELSPTTRTKLQTLCSKQ